MLAHAWTESDDVAALYFALHGEGLYSIDTVAKRPRAEMEAAIDRLIEGRS